MNGSTLPISVQASLLELNRSGLYYQPAPHSTEDLYIKQMIDKIYTRYPMYGYRRICWYLNEKEHYLINHKAVLRHMQEMGIQAIYPRQNTSKPEHANKVYPYLLKGLKIDHPDQVWSIDITYIPVKTDWLYLVAIIDWYSRFVLHWQLSDTMEIGFVLDTSHKALKVSKPEIMNSDYAEFGIILIREVILRAQNSHRFFWMPDQKSVWITVVALTIISSLKGSGEP